MPLGCLSLWSPKCISTSKSDGEAPFPLGGEVWRVKVTQSPFCYLLGIELHQGVYSGILIMRNYSNEGKEFYLRLFNTLKLCC